MAIVTCSSCGGGLGTRLGISIDTCTRVVSMVCHVPYHKNISLGKVLVGSNAVEFCNSYLANSWIYFVS